MGFLDFLRGGQQEKPLELSLEEIPKFIERQVSGKRGQLNKALGKKFSEIKFVLKQMNSLLGELKSQPIESQNVKLNKIVVTAREQAIARLSSLISKLQPPSPDNLESVKRYCTEGTTLIHRQVTQGGKSIVYTGIFLKALVKQLGQSVQELNNHFVELNKLIQEFSPVFLEKQLLESVNTIREKSRSIALGEEEIEKANDTLLGLEKEKKRIFSEITALKESASFREIYSLQEKKSALLKEKQAKKTELVSLIATIDKPLKRLSKAVESNRFSLPQSMRETLLQLQRNPLQLLKKDPKGQSIKPLLLELKRALESSVIELKEHERAKKLSAIDELLAFNFFSNVFWKLNEIDRQLHLIEKQLNEKPVLKKLSKLESALQECEKAIQETGFSLETVKGKLEREREELSLLWHKTEGLLHEICKANIVLK